MYVCKSNESIKVKKQHQTFEYQFFHHKKTDQINVM